MKEQIEKIKEFVVTHKKAVIIVGAILAVGTAAYIIYKKRKSASSRR